MASNDPSGILVKAFLLKCSFSRNEKCGKGFAFSRLGHLLLDNDNTFSGKSWSIATNFGTSTSLKSTPSNLTYSRFGHPTNALLSFQFKCVSTKEMYSKVLLINVPTGGRPIPLAVKCNV
jgi:hypothetical protein